MKFTVKVRGKNGNPYKVTTKANNVLLALGSNYDATKTGAICEMSVSTMKKAYNYATKIGIPRNRSFESTLGLYEVCDCTIWSNGVVIVPDKNF